MHHTMYPSLFWQFGYKVVAVSFFGLIFSVTKSVKCIASVQIIDYPRLLQHSLSIIKSISFLEIISCLLRHRRKTII